MTFISRYSSRSAAVSDCAALIEPMLAFIAACRLTGYFSIASANSGTDFRHCSVAFK